MLVEDLFVLIKHLHILLILEIEALYFCICLNSLFDEWSVIVQQHQHKVKEELLDSFA